MVNSEKNHSVNDRDVDDAEDGIQRFLDGDCREDLTTSTAVVDPSSSVESASDSRLSAATVEAPRAREEDVLQSDPVDNLLQWLRALDVHVMGACRADERLKPLLKLNAFTGAAEDRLLSHLSQNFEPSEVGMLARGNLNLTLLPTSGLRLSFIGDDGLSERLVTLTSDAQCSAVEIEGILADDSGRSFLIKIPNKEIFYFWCSEKSKLLGNELLGKMKDLLKRKPCLAELTGISESRLESFAIHLRAYLVGSTMTNARAGSVFTMGASSVENSLASADLGHNFQSSMGSKSSRSRLSGGQGAKPSPLYQGSLSPRPSSFKEGVARNLSSLRTVSRERIRCRGDSYVSCIDNLVVPSPCSPDASSSNGPDGKFPEASGGHLFPPSILLETPGKSVVGNPTIGSAAQVPLMGSSLFSPYYCWCPPVAPGPQRIAGSAPLFTSPPESLSLPTSLLSVSKMSGPLTLKLPLNQHEVTLDFPPLLPEPLVMLPLSLPAQQIPTFTPLMCDSIVHIPVIDVCSSGQGYLVSAGPAISTAIPPMHPNLSSPLIPEADSAVEKNARETLRMLINSSNQTSPPLIEVLPSVLTKGNEMQSILAAGSRGLYGGTKDVDAIACSMAAMGLVSTERFVVRRCTSREDIAEELENSDYPTGGSEGSLPKSGTI